LTYGLAGFAGIALPRPLRAADSNGSKGPDRAAVILSVAKDLLSEAGSQTGRVDPSAVGLRMT